MKKVTILTLFPEYFQQIFQHSILGRAQAQELVSLECVNIRDFATDAHRVTDDRPYGGGPGMVMKIEPIFKALECAQLVDQQGLLKPDQRPEPTLVALTSAKGQLFSQQTASDWSSNYEHLVLICGHYAGVDERVADHLVDLEIRIGNYVLTGGEPAAAVITDAVTRLVPGVLGNEASPLNESHTTPGTGSHPLYTRPESFMGWPVPAVLLEGHHQNIEEWRTKHQTKLLPTDSDT